MKNKFLFKEFNNVSTEEWIEKANIDLKGADFNRKLVWKNLSGIDIQPFYNTENTLNYLPKTGSNTDSLINYRSIEVSDANDGNHLAKKAISEGINGLIFNLKHNLSMDTLLDQIDLNSVAIAFKAEHNILEIATSFFQLAEAKKIDAHKLIGYFDLRLIQNYTATKYVDPDNYEILLNLIKLSSTYINYKAITISGSIFTNSGANQAQEIAYTLNLLVDVIEQCSKRDIETQSIIDNLHFQLAIGSEYFVEMAKLRAFNHLLNNVASKYGIHEFKHHLLAKTASWNKSITDAHTNMLRATTEAMSAILGNADALLIDTYDNEFNDPNEFSQRIAGNIATILKEESYFGKVANPVDGSYYIEQVSLELTNQALNIFLSIEEMGGFFKAYENQHIQNQIAQIRDKKLELIRQRKLTMVGVNKYPNLMESLTLNQLNTKNLNLEHSNDILISSRAYTEIEALRFNTERIVNITKQRPGVELTSFGNLTMRKARTAFAFDFMGVSGFNILPEKSYDSVKVAAQQSAKSDSQIVVICSSDEDYKVHAKEFVNEFRSINKNKILLLAGNPEEILENLYKNGLDGCIHVKSDIIQTLSKIQKKIEKNIKPIEV